jgi:hypothetical protein
VVGVEENPGEGLYVQETLGDREAKAGIIPVEIIRLFV